MVSLSSASPIVESDVINAHSQHPTDPKMLSSKWWMAEAERISADNENRDFLESVEKAVGLFDQAAEELGADRVKSFRIRLRIIEPNSNFTISRFKFLDNLAFYQICLAEHLFDCIDELQTPKLIVDVEYRLVDFMNSVVSMSCGSFSEAVVRNIALMQNYTPSYVKIMQIMGATQLIDHLNTQYSTFHGFINALKSLDQTVHRNKCLETESVELECIADALSRSSGVYAQLLSRSHERYLDNYRRKFRLEKHNPNIIWSLVKKPDVHAIEYRFALLGCAIVSEEAEPNDREKWLLLLEELIPDMEITRFFRENQYILYLEITERKRLQRKVMDVASQRITKEVLLPQMIIFGRRLFDHAFENRSEEKFQKLLITLEGTLKTLISAMQLEISNNYLEILQKDADFKQKNSDFYSMKCKIIRMEREIAEKEIETEEFQVDLAKKELESLQKECSVLQSQLCAPYEKYELERYSLEYNKHSLELAKESMRCRVSHLILTQKSDGADVGIRDYLTGLLDQYEKKIDHYYSQSKQGRKDSASLKYWETLRKIANLELKRCIAHIGEIEWSLAKGADPKLLFDLEQLNGFFYTRLCEYKFYSERCAELAPRKNVLESLKEEAWHQVKKCAFLDFCDEDFWTEEDFLREKHYADMGYSMERYLREWNFELEPGKSVYDYLNIQFNEFLQWAERHPHQATSMIGNLAHSFSILFAQDTSLVSQFKQRMEVQSYSITLLDPLGTGADKLDVKEELRFKALADLSSYLPVTSKIAKVASNILAQNSTFLGACVELWKGVTEVRIAQHLANRIPPEYYQDAVHLTSLLQGEGFASICMRQRNIELVRICGVARKLFLHPGTFLPECIRQFRVSWRAGCLSEGSEKLARIASQVILPLGCILGTIHLIALAATVGKLAIATTALWASLTLFGTTWMIFWKLNSLISLTFGVANWKEAQRLVENQERERLPEGELHKLLEENLERDHGAKIDAAVEEYLLDLQAANRAPRALENCAVNLSVEEESVVSKVVEELSPDYSFPSSSLLEKATLAVNTSKVTSRPQRLADEVVRRITQTVLKEQIRPKLRKELIESSIRANSASAQIAVDDTIKEFLDHQEGFSDAFVEKQGSKKFVKLWKYNREL